MYNTSKCTWWNEVAHLIQLKFNLDKFIFKPAIILLMDEARKKNNTQTQTHKRKPMFQITWHRR